ncbi:hypothetical protein C8A05DRAFT_34448 [Staphylotrichum tortipilum]|uniref:NmrA-like domain-containing protein n=1 Tax=Staphylotrichum tortipilum TaxID=2831512 RepID=A0AAN6MJR2_9PEZI|nr:hypothetical protein C8A05DRAFT_34448 [Staphylotrichum longicolle]
MPVFVLTGANGGLGQPMLATILKENLILVSDLRISTTKASSVPAEIPYSGGNVLFLVSFPSIGEARFALHRNGIDAAKAPGIRHVIYTSLSFSGPGGNISVAQVVEAHLQTEAYLKQSGLTYTIVCMATYAHLWNNYAGFLWLDEDPAVPVDAVLPGDGPAHWANREELGDATARIVANWVRPIHNQTLTITGPELLTGVEILQKYLKHTGRTGGARVLPVEEAIAWHMQYVSVPPEQASFLDNWASWHTANSLGESAFVDPTLERLLGRKPRPVDDQAGEIFGEGNGLDTKDLVGI